MNELIKAAAEEAIKIHNLPDRMNKEFIQAYSEGCKHFLDYAKSQGVEMVKVEGDVNDIAFELVKQHLDKMLDLPNHLLPRILSDTLKQALAIGKAHGVREIGEFAEWASKEGWIYVDGAWDYYHTLTTETKTTAELITEFQNREV